MIVYFNGDDNYSGEFSCKNPGKLKGETDT